MSTPKGVFHTNDQILNALNDNQQTLELIRWLEGACHSTQSDNEKNDNFVSNDNHGGDHEKNFTIIGRRRQQQQQQQQQHGHLSFNQGPYYSNSFSSLVGGMDGDIDYQNQLESLSSINHDSAGVRREGNRQAGHYRIHASYCILNGIRDACRSILESQSHYFEQKFTNSDTTEKSSDGSVELGSSIELGQQTKHKSTTRGSNKQNNSNNPQTGQGSSKKARKKIKPSMVSLSSSTESRTFDYSNMAFSASQNAASYEESFPSLGSTSKSVLEITNTTLLTTRKKKQPQQQLSMKPSFQNAGIHIKTQNQKTKRRIRPMSTTSTNREHNISNLVSTTSNTPHTISTLISVPPSSMSSSFHSIPSSKQQSSSKSVIDSPWNQIIRKSGKKDPMERIMNSKVREISKSKQHEKTNDYNEKGDVNKALTNENDPGSQQSQEHHSESARISMSNTKHSTRLPEESSPSKMPSHNPPNILSEKDDTNTNKNTTIPSTNNDTSTTQTIESTNAKQKQLLKQPFFQNLVNVYFTIIKCQLLPSMSLELQFILQLLALQDSKVATNTMPTLVEESKTTSKQKVGMDEGINTNQGKGINKQASNRPLPLTSPTKKLQEIFSSPFVCQQFAVTILIKLKPILANLTKGIILSLLNLKPFQFLVPKDMISYLYESIEARIILDHHRTTSNKPRIGKDESINCNNRSQHELGIGNESFGDGSLGSMSKSTILNISFDEQRDSRHRFKSKDLVPIYNNREQCRGEFNICFDDFVVFSSCHFTNFNYFLFKIFSYSN